MQTVDFHAHLLNPNVSFSRLYDKIAISLFAKRLELEKIENPLDRYISFFNQYFDENSQVYTNWQKLIRE